LMVLAVNTAQASTLLYWNYENYVSGSGSIATSYSGGVTGLSDTTWGSPTEGWGIDGPTLLITRWFGGYFPYVSFTTTTQLVVDSLTFYHEHNHNPGFPTNPDYDVQLQINSGSGYSDIGASFLAYNDGGWGYTSIDLGSITLDPGTYTIRWDPRNLTWGSDTNTEFFALDGVSLTGSPVPEPATMLLLASGLAGLAGFRKRFRKA
jgi:hypothetical protein